MLKKLLGILLITALVATGCASGSSAGGSSAAPAEIKIGLSGPMTGDISDIGQSSKNAAEMAVEEVNAAGGLKIGDKKIPVKLVVGDDENKPESAANVFQKLINQDKVLGIIGPPTSKCANAGAPIAESAGTVMVSSWATNVNVTKDKKFVFRACFIDPFQGLVNANFAADTLKAKKAAVLYDVASDYNKGLAEVFRDEFKKKGGEIVAFESYSTGDKDFASQLTKIKAANPEVLFLPNYYNEVALQLQQAKRLGITAKVLGGDAWDSPKIFDLAGKDLLEGTYFSNHYAADADNADLQKFITKYKEKYKLVPDATGALTYDAIRILFQGIEKAGSTDKKAIRDAVAATTDFKGITGTISYKGSGDPVKSAVMIQITEGKYKYAATVNP
ncbi:MAG: ABC transporter substrate-binding protein [Peptococcaceae bacterium]|nr:ABC transporter substrate-binding protein [Peptococcaceae bacterium]